MPIMLHVKGPYVVVQVVCDHCKDVIDDAKQGNYQYRAEPESLPGVMYFTHKHCCRAFEHAMGGSWGWVSLSALPYYLANSLHVTWEASSKSGHIHAWDV